MGAVCTLGFRDWRKNLGDERLTSIWDGHDVQLGIHPWLELVVVYGCYEVDEEMNNVFV